MTDGGDSSATLLDALRFPAATLDDRGRVVAANQELLRAGARRDAVLFDLFDDTPGGAAARARFGDGVLRGVLDDAVVVERGPGDDATDDRVRLHMRSLPVGAAAFAVIVIEPLPGDVTLESRIDGLEGRLAGIGPVKHSIGNPLMGIVGYADLLRQRVSDPESVRLIEGIAAQCDRIETCLEQLDALRYGNGAPAGDD